jgi:hypothetical protein
MLDNSVKPIPSMNIVSKFYDILTEVFGGFD